MWARIQEMAIRGAAPEPLEPGSEINGARVRRRIPSIMGFRCYEAVRDYEPLEIRQFLDVDTTAFLSWQNAARFAGLSHDCRFLWPVEEWEQGLILPAPKRPVLADLLDDSEFGIEQGLSLCARLVASLADLHEAGIAHLALHPGNLLVAPANGPLWIREFGLAHRRGWNDFWGGSAPSPADVRYAAPEQLRGRHGARVSDIFSLGVLAFRILANRLPFAFHHRLFDGWPMFLFKPSLLRDDVPRDVVEVVRACLEFDPRSRSRMADIVAAFAPYLPGEAVPDACSVDLPPPASSASRSRIMAFVQPDERAPLIFETALNLAAQEEVAVLFVSLVPVQLPTGELERFKAALFAALAPGLRQCREQKLFWGLRVLENVDPGRAAPALICQYGPDIVLAGRSDRSGIKSRLAPGVVRCLEKCGANLRLVA